MHSLQRPFALVTLCIFSACNGAAGGDAGSGSAAGAPPVSAAGAGGGAGGAGVGGGASGSRDSGGAAGITPGGGNGGSSGGPKQSGGASGMGGHAARGSSGEAGASGAPNEVGLSWPIDCIPNQTCLGIGYPDTDKDGQAHDCGEPGYPGHEGTDISISAEAMVAGTAVRAAADGVVLFAFDGKYDQCPNANEPDCQAPADFAAGAKVGNTVCTPLGPYCGSGSGSCFWCFAGGNVIVIRHPNVPGVFATRYDHLKKSSLRVRPGDEVRRGQQIAEAASAGNSTGPHLHFEVWSTGFYELADPWPGQCGPNHGPSLWAHEPPWAN